MKLINRHTPGNGIIWLTDVTCTQGDVFLANCTHSGFGGVSCSHSEDVALSCITGTHVFMHDTQRALVYISPCNVSFYSML